MNSKTSYEMPHHDSLWAGVEYYYGIILNFKNKFLKHPTARIKRPAGFKPSIAQQRNPLGSAVDTRIGQAISLPPFPSQYSPIKVPVPLSSMIPFYSGRRNRFLGS
jgi:hypothetical protein